MIPIKKKFLYIPVLFCLPFTGISQHAALSAEAGSPVNIIEEYEKGYYSQLFGYSIYSMRNKSLFETISNWLGTPYCYSGKSANGIDCSGFVNMLYQKVYDISLSGNSRDLYARAKHLKKNELAEGDLVFFRIRKNHVSHVGIYMGQNKFAHASLHNGVIISDLDEPYYKKYFVKGGRLNDTF